MPCFRLPLLRVLPDREASESSKSTGVSAAGEKQSRSGFRRLQSLASALLLLLFRDSAARLVRPIRVHAVACVLVCMQPQIEAAVHSRDAVDVCVEED